MAPIPLLIGSVGALIVELVGLGLRNDYGWEPLLLCALPASVAGLGFCVLGLMRARGRATEEKGPVGPFLGNHR